MEFLDLCVDLTTYFVSNIYLRKKINCGVIYCYVHSRYKVTYYEKTSATLQQSNQTLEDFQSYNVKQSAIYL